MEQQARAPLAFCSRPPSCLEALSAGKVDLEEVEKVFRDEARNLQSRLREELSQLRIELGLFLRLMYKNKNQHRRTLYYQRLSEVRRDLQMLSKSGLDVTVEGFSKFFTAKRPEDVSSKAVTQSKFKDAIDESKALRILLGVARLLNQSDGPILAGSAQLAGLLGQSFFMPFALTMFSCLARFRVLLIQILYEVVTAFNLLSAVWQKKQKSLIYSAKGSASVVGRNLSAELECQWDGVKLSMTEKKIATDPDSRWRVSDLPAEPSQLWFVDDRTGVKCDLQISAAIAGPPGEQLGVKSQVPYNSNKGTIGIPEVEKMAKFGPIPEVWPNISRPDPKEDIATPSTQDFTAATETDDQAKHITASHLAIDLPTKLPMIHGGVTDLSGLRESSGQGQVSDYRHDSGTSSGAKRSVAYRSISHKIVPDSTRTDNIVQNVQIGAKKNGTDMDVQQEMHKSSKVTCSQHMTRSSTDQRNDPSPDSVVVEDRVHWILSTLPLSFRSRSMETVESGIPNPKLTQIEPNQESTIESSQIDSVQGDAAVGTSGPVAAFEVKDSLVASVENVTTLENSGIIQLANGEFKAQLEHSPENCGPESSAVDIQNGGLTVKLPCDDANQVGSATTEGSNSHDMYREAPDGRAVDQNGSRDFALNKSLCPDLRSSQSSNEESNSANQNVPEKDDVKPNQVGEVPIGTTYVHKAELQSANGSIAHPSIGFDLGSADLHESGPSPSVFNNAVASSRSSLSEEGRSVICVLTNPSLISLSNGKDEKTCAGQEHFRLGGNDHTQIPEKVELEQVTEQSGGTNERASIANLQQNARSRTKMPVAYVSIKSDLKACQNKREDGAKSRPQVKKIADSEKRQQLSIGLDENPAQSEKKRGKVDSKDRSSESESKRKKTNDIFAMLLGGSD